MENLFWQILRPKSLVSSLNPPILHLMANPTANLIDFGLKIYPESSSFHHFLCYSLTLSPRLLLPGLLCSLPSFLPVSTFLPTTNTPHNGQIVSFWSISQNMSFLCPKPISHRAKSRSLTIPKQTLQEMTFCYFSDSSLLLSLLLFAAATTDSLLFYICCLQWLFSLPVTLFPNDLHD